jgi:hypothetical protein
MNRRDVLRLLPALSAVYLGVAKQSCAHAAWPGQDAHSGNTEKKRQGTSSGWPSSQSGPSPNPSAAISAAQGCSLRGNALNEGAISNILIPDHQIPPLLLAKAHAFNDTLKNVYQLAPGLGFINDATSLNAFAVAKNLLPTSNHGTILLGWHLLNSEYQKSPSTWEGAAILIHAHEFGHIAQFKYFGAMPVTLMELQADALAGCVMAHQFIMDSMSNMSLNYLQAMQHAQQKMGDFTHASSSVFGMGSYDFNNPNFHGTPIQRLTAFRGGFQYIAQSPSARSIPEIMNVTRNFAQRLLA